MPDHNPTPELVTGHPERIHGYDYGAERAARSPLTLELVPSSSDAHADSCFNWIVCSQAAGTTSGETSPFLAERSSHRDSAGAMEAAVHEHDPEFIVCPFLKAVIPESVWAKHRCLIIHPGPKGDRGPSSLDWAIELGASAWGVTVLEANGDLDAGEVWATRSFPMREAGKQPIPPGGATRRHRGADRRHRQGRGARRGRRRLRF